MKETVPSSEFSDLVVKGMRDRMAVGYFRYGKVADAYPHKVSALESLQKRLEKYAETGNTEFLIDAANFCLIEFMSPSHPGAHFKATDSNESPGRCAYDTNFEATQKDNSELSDKEWKTLQRMREENAKGLLNES